MFLRNAWYVAAWSEEVGAGLFERTVIGESLLLFRKPDGSPVALTNMCPHRFAPLNLGTLADGVVECPYHGLRFDARGTCVHNPHGDGHIPAKARLRSYPVVERHAMLWVWMGDDALADPAGIPDFSCHTDPRFPRVGGVIEMHAQYELITDNLMDLTHVEFVHRGILGSDAIKRGAHEIVQNGTTVYSNRWCPDGLAPPAWDMMMGHYGKPVDHWLNMRWDAPAHMLLDVGITPTGKSRDEGIWVYGTDILTPRDERSTWYFWGVCRSHDVDNPAVSEAWTRAIDAAFAGQDKPIIEAQQRMMGTRTFEELDPVLLGTDSGPMRCRRLLRKLIDAQPGGALPEPRNPPLSTLYDDVRATVPVRPAV